MPRYTTAIARVLCVDYGFHVCEICDSLSVTLHMMRWCRAQDVVAYRNHGCLATPLLWQQASFTQLLLHSLWVGTVLVNLQTHSLLIITGAKRQEGQFAWSSPVSPCSTVPLMASSDTVHTDRLASASSSINDRPLAFEIQKTSLKSRYSARKIKMY